MRIVFTPLAERHLDALHDHIARQSDERRADAYVGRIIAYCQGFSLFPERGTRRDDLLPGLRIIGFERSVTIAFVVTAQEILIEGVHAGGRDFETVHRRVD